MGINWGKVREDLTWVIKQLPMWIGGGLIGFYGPELLIRWNPLGLEYSEPELYMVYVLGAMASFLVVLLAILAYLKLRLRYVEDDKE